MNPIGIVHQGYDRVSYACRPVPDAPDCVDDAGWFAKLGGLLPPAAVLDLGCGCGIPVTRAGSSNAASLS